MPVYTITFELNGEGGKRDYAGLVEELKKQRCHPVLRNHWLGSFKNSAVQVQNHFRKLIGKTDRIMVAELFRHYAYANSLPNCSKWLELNPPADQAASAPV
ncbi:MAG TPA: hypothetical protein VLA37_05150, partial [Sphingomonadaceae bacterium]|nr:hypothetical protein [Sphingomonadaceae bacterium]